MTYKNTAFVHVDVDGLWAVRRCYGRPEGTSFRRDPVWENGLPALRDLFRQLDLRSSFFIVGRDLEVESKREELRRLVDAGHEIANHSYNHVLGMTLMPVGQMLEEITATHRAIVSAGAPAPTGFRAPGYDVDSRVLNALRRARYHYDASLLPTRLGTALRLADAWLAQRFDSRKKQFGRFAFARAPQRPYFPDPHRVAGQVLSWGESRLVEIPVSVTRGIRFPITGSFIFALGARRARRIIERRARAGRPLLLLLHGIDAVDCRRPIIFSQRTPAAGGFNMSSESKLTAIRQVLETVQKCYDVQVSREWVKRYVEDPR